ncbi:MAG: CHAT domain-containing protein [Alphaproteobacteria bacterium]|nr:CHAT domain-containing protein [Alphaproteobacteria bacterium]
MMLAQRLRGLAFGACLCATAPLLAIALAHADTADDLKRIESLFDAGRYADAEPVAKALVEKLESTRGPDHPETATGLLALGRVHAFQGRFRQAEPLLRRALAIRGKALGPEHPETASTQSVLGGVLNNTGKHAEAERLLRRALATREKALGPGHLRTADTVNNLAIVDRGLGRLESAEAGFRRVVAIRTKELGAEHGQIVAPLQFQAEIAARRGRTAEAVPLARRALAIAEKAYAGDHPAIALALTGYARVLQMQGQVRDALAFHERALGIRERRLGPDHLDVATSLNLIGSAERILRRYKEAEAHLLRAQTIREKALGKDDVQVGYVTGLRARVAADQGRWQPAIALYQRTLQIWEKAWGPDHPELGAVLANLANAQRTLGKLKDAEASARRSLAIREKALGPDHLDVARSLGVLGQVMERARQDASPVFKRAAAILEAHGRPGDADRGGAASGELRSMRWIYDEYMRTLSRQAERIADRSVGKRFVAGNAGKVREDAFAAMQRARASSAAAAVAQMAVRFAAQDDALALAIRERQDLVQRREAIEAVLLQQLARTGGERDAAAEAKARNDIADLEARVAALGTRIEKEFPRYAELADPKPAPLSLVQSLLQADEAMLAFVVAEDESYVMAIRKESAIFRKVAVTRDALRKAVSALRRGLDPTGKSDIAEMPAFPASVAWRLYQDLFGPVEATLADAKHVIVVPDGALQSLPIGVLLTKDSGAAIRDAEAFKRAPWLARTYAMTVIPSVTSLRALRAFATDSRAGKPFLGIGDPLLKGHPGGAAAPAAKPTRALGTLSLVGESDAEDATNKLFRGDVADVRAVREVPALPETARELASLAKSLDAGGDALVLREQATESSIKGAAGLKDYRVIAFATHGVVAGEIDGLAEPALILTPPDAASRRDDGLLTASEIAQGLKLDADWVILSACNTAAGGRPGAEGLGGLASAFFYAGSRALLVSHWPVVSDAAVAITTTMLKLSGADPALPRAEAHRQAMLALIDGKADPAYAHPLFWAPFVVVGEGGPLRRPR